VVLVSQPYQITAVARGDRGLRLQCPDRRPGHTCRSTRFSQHSHKSIFKPRYIELKPFPGAFSCSLRVRRERCRVVMKLHQQQLSFCHLSLRIRKAPQSPVQRFHSARSSYLVAHQQAELLLDSPCVLDLRLRFSQPLASVQEKALLHPIRPALTALFVHSHKALLSQMNFCQRMHQQKTIKVATSFDGLDLFGKSVPLFQMGQIFVHILHQSSQ